MIPLAISIRRRRMGRPLYVLGCLCAVTACTAAPPAPTPGPTLSPLEVQGRVVFNLNCAPCHATAPDTIIAGPSLAGIASAAGTRIPGMDAASYLRESIISPYDYLVEGYTEAMPPDFGKRLTGEEFDAVLAFLLTLK